LPFGGAHSNGEYTESFLTFRGDLFICFSGTERFKFLTSGAGGKQYLSFQLHSIRNSPQIIMERKLPRITIGT
jgi:hypothetical protein